MAEEYPVRARDVAFRPFEDELLLVSAHQGRIVSLNSVGAFVWDSIDGRRSVEEIASMVCEHYDVEPETALADVSELLRSLAERGALSLEDSPMEGA